MYHNGVVIDTVFWNRMCALTLGAFQGTLMSGLVTEMAGGGVTVMGGGGMCIAMQGGTVMETMKAGGGTVMAIAREQRETGTHIVKEEEEVGGTEIVTEGGGGVVMEGGEMPTRTEVEAIGTEGEVAIVKEGQDTAIHDLAVMEIVMAAGEEVVMAGEILVCWCAIVINSYFTSLLPAFRQEIKGGRHRWQGEGRRAAKARKCVVEGQAKAAGQWCTR